MNCKNCGASVRPGTTRCVKCGSLVEWPQQPQTAPPPPQVVYVPQQQAYPTQAPVQQPIAMGPPKSKVAAALLAFFLGCLGIHNFYLGYTGRGLAQLLITVLTLGYGVIVTGIWAFIEFILILTGSIKDKFGRPLT